MFARDGVERARIDAVAARAGVAIGTIYNHIGDRDALFGAVLTMRRAEIVAALDAALEASAKQSAADQLEAVARATLGYLERHRGFFTIVLESADGPRHHVKPSQTVTELRTRIERIVRRGVRDKTLRADLARLHTTLFLGMLRAAIRDRIADADGPSPEVWARGIVTLFLEGAARERKR